MDKMVEKKDGPALACVTPKSTCASRFISTSGLPVATTTRRVLILEFDLFKTVGGGQTTYKRIIELDPQTHYYYFVRNEPINAQRPSNTTAIPLSIYYYAKAGGLPAEMIHFYSDYLTCWQMASSISEYLGACSFDVVDVPDYTTLGLFIREALSAHRIDVGVVALALHGTISSALRDQWPRSSAPKRTLAELRFREHLQYRIVDVRYALAARYAQHWTTLTGLSARPLDPLLIVGTMRPVEAPPGGPPDILFVGRLERRKGPDIFLDMLWALTPSSYGQAQFIGADAPGSTGVSATPLLTQMAAKRGIVPSFLRQMSPPELDTKFRGRSIIILPSRYDQFNLIALEALRHGCPTFVSRGAGVADWIETNFPTLADLVIDIDCGRGSVGAVRAAIDDYDSYRCRLVETLEKSIARQIDQSTLFDIYRPLGLRDAAACLTLNDIRSRLDSFNRPRPLSELGKLHSLKVSLRRNLRPLADAKHFIGNAGKALKHSRPLRSMARFAVQKWLRNDDTLIYVRRAAEIERMRSRLLETPERTAKEIESKLRLISQELGSTKFARTQITRDLARLERKRGGDLIAATYCLRVMRWLGRDVYNDLEFVEQTLGKHNFAQEAEAAKAIYGDPRRAEERCRSFLEEKFQRHLVKPDLPTELVDDRRGASTPRVTVIASLYNAASKLPTLLRNMSVSSIARRGELEIVLVDSGSPADEYGAFQAFAATSDLPILYLRSAQRETIQAAWNRGIKAARAPYLSFLGVDEGLHPDALSILADELDRQPDVDWAMADSIVTEVDKSGIFAGDVMVYNRTGYNQNLVYLETCYLSWVGGLYRKSIHDRFGYYDETFRAAGDTEFKSRILRHIKTMHVPQCLGVFNNYPEERTTQHPRAEIEDLRAWYLHRTLAGVAYSFDALPIARAKDLFRSSLAYRKSYCGHISTDFDMAAVVGSYLARRAESGEYGRLADISGRQLLECCRTADALDFQLSPKMRQWTIWKALQLMRNREKLDQAVFGMSGRPHYHMFNDNRYEQHWWSWSV